MAHYIKWNENMNYGRRQIFTDAEQINSQNVINVLRNSYGIHKANAQDCDFLLNYEAGQQPIVREKTYRPDINVIDIDNVANEITEFKLGFNWGYPITLIQRGEKKDGKPIESEAINLLNSCYESQDIKTKTQELARFVEICGIGYTFVDINTEYDDGDSYFTINVLDPRTTFVVRSSRYVDHRVLMAVTFRKDSQGNTYFTCFTDKARYEIVNLVKIINGKTNRENKADIWDETDRSGEHNPLGVIPIIEYIRAHDRMGCFERQIPELDALNLLASDFGNEVDQNTQCIWHTNDVNFPEDDNGVETPRSGDWVQTFTSKDGKTPFITPLTVDYNYTGMLNNYVTKRALILQKCNVPQRNDNSGGSTGIAMSDATGWSSAEASACKQQNITESSKMAEVKVVLTAIGRSTDVPSDSPLLKLKATDIKPNIKRQKSYELAVKSNALATLLAHGIYGKDVLEVVNLFEDVNSTWNNSKTLIKRFQDKAFKEEEVIDVEGKSSNQDNSSQIDNSPMLDGMDTDNSKKSENDRASETAEKINKK